MSNKKNMINQIVRSANEAVNRDNLEANLMIADILLKPTSSARKLAILDKYDIRIISQDTDRDMMILLGPNGVQLAFSRRWNQLDISNSNKLARRRRYTVDYGKDKTRFSKIDFVTMLTQPEYIEHSRRHVKLDDNPKQQYAHTNLDNPSLVDQNDILITYYAERNRLKYGSLQQTRKNIMQTASSRSGLQVNPGRTPRITKAWWKNDK